MSFCTIRFGHFRGKMRIGIPHDWIASILSDPLEMQFLRICYRPLPESYGTGKAVVKVYDLGKKRRFFKRFKRGRAWREGQGYLQFQERGIHTVNLLFFGEERRFGVLKRGIVVTQRFEAQTVAKAYSLKPSIELLEQATNALARIHLAGLAHGDPRTNNFLATEPGPLPFDLPSWSFLTTSSQSRDLVRFLGSVLALPGGVTGTQRLIARYCLAGLHLPVAEHELMEKAIAYCEKKGKP